MGQRLHIGARTVDLASGDVSDGGRLRPMERALLAYLAARPDEVVSIDELHARVWGYAAQVQSRTVYTTINRLRLCIEPDPVNPRHLLSVRGAGYALREVTLAGAPQARGPGNVPPSGRPCVGRDRELHALATGSAPVTSLVGPGGSGKTRLAAEAAAAAALPGGTWRCELHACAGEAALLGALSAVLPGATPDPQRIGASLAALGRAAVILDDADEVAEALAGWLPRWTAADAGNPGLRWLVTSRRRVWLPGAPVIEVGPLAPADAEAVLRDQVRQAAPDRALALDPAQVAELIALSDGLPLALEIVAAHVALIGADEVARALRGGRALRNPRGGRHPTSLDVVRWSWDRLSEPLRDALVTLCALGGAFRMPVAEVLLGDDAFDAVSALIDRGLLRALDGPRGQWFEPFHVVSAFAASLGRAAPEPRSTSLEAAAAYDRLTAFITAHDDPAGADHAYLRMVVPTEVLPLHASSWDRLIAHARDRHPRETWAVVVHAALRSATQAPQPDRMLALARDLSAAPDPALCARAKVLEAHELARAGRDAEAERAYDDATERCRRLGPAATIHALHLRGTTLADTGRPGVAELADEILALAGELAPPLAAMARGIAHNLRLRAHAIPGAWDDAVEEGRTSASQFRLAGDTLSALLVDGNTAVVLMGADRDEEAAAVLGSAVADLETFPELRHSPYRGWLRLQRADALDRLERWEEALVDARTGIALVEGTRSSWVGHGLTCAGRIAMNLGDDDSAIGWYQRRVAFRGLEARGECERRVDEVYLAVLTGRVDEAIGRATALVRDLADGPADTLQSAVDVEARARMAANDAIGVAAVAATVTAPRDGEIVLAHVDALIRLGRDAEARARLEPFPYGEKERRQAAGFRVWLDAREGRFERPVPEGRGWRLRMQQACVRSLATGAPPDPGPLATMPAWARPWVAATHPR